MEDSRDERAERLRLVRAGEGKEGAQAIGPVRSAAELEGVVVVDAREDAVAMARGSLVKLMARDVDKGRRTREDADALAKAVQKVSEVFG